MIFESSLPKRQYFVPEIIQTSSMDCGPASLKALLEGFGIDVNYSRLREACQTDVDGTSIDTIENIACDLGLEAIQVIVPADHLFLAQTNVLPSIVVIRQPNGLTHFIVVWRTLGSFIQIMDPSTGRSWWTQKHLLKRLYIHSLPVSAEFAFDWITSEDFISPLQFRLSELGLNEQDIDHFIENAIDHTSWQTIAALDAAARLSESLLKTGSIQPGKEAGRILEHFFTKASGANQNQFYETIPSTYWSIHLIDNHPHINGAVLITVDGITISETNDETSETIQSEKISSGLSRLQDPEPDEKSEMYRLIMTNGPIAVITVIATLTLTSLGVFFEAFILKGLIDFNYLSDLINRHMQLAGSIYFFFMIRFLLELSAIAVLLYMGRWFEIHIRIAILKKIPRLGDRYFHSRLTSDMAQRAHEIRQLRELPNLSAHYYKILFEILLTAAGIIWIYPSSAAITIPTIAIILGISFLTQPILKEQDLSFRTHIGAMNRFYLDALLGLIPIRTHCAGKAVQNEHEVLQVRWWDAGHTFFRTYLIIATVELVVITGFAILIIFNYVKYSGEASGVLLLVYWIMKLPVLTENLSNILQQYPMQRNRMLRLLEMLNSREETDLWYDDDQSRKTRSSDISSVSLSEQSTDDGVEISMEKVTVCAGGLTILKDIDLNIARGEHIAIVGPSGAGKSSLAGLLLGLHRPFSGAVMADKKFLHGDHLKRIRKETAWIDPSVHIWNRSMKDNLCYGNTTHDPTESVMENANLNEILRNLPQGSQTPLGESGGLLSGGEGQRVRLGRALLRSNIRLAILDEPFRGLDREQRQALLKYSRMNWQQATLIYISHDIAEALTFDTVIVMDNGKIIEKNNPNSLMSISTSKFRTMLDASQNLYDTLWNSDHWKRWQLKKGELV
jgi:ATP-binding cassette subfamily B protein